MNATRVVSLAAHKTASACKRIPIWFPRDVLLPVVVSRLMLTLVAWLGFQLCQTTVRPGIGAVEISREGKQVVVGDHFSTTAHPFINMWSRWDSHWYFPLAKRGYDFKPNSTSTAAFFPLYPRLMRVVHYFVTLPDDAGWMLAGIILSNVMLLVALCYFFLLVRMDFDETIAARSVLYLLIFPVTLFLSAAYNESLFLTLAVAAFYYARRSRWLLASVLGALAARCRSPGFLLAIPLAFEYLVQKNFRWREIKIDILWFALIPFALFLHVADLRFRYGSWDILGQAQAGFGRGFALLPVTVWRFLTGHHPLQPADNANIDFTFLLCFFVLIVYGAFRLRPSYTVYAVLSVLFVTTWGHPHSISRFGLVIFPLFIALALLGRNEQFNRYYFVASSMLAAFFMFLFSQWVWVA